MSKNQVKINELEASLGIVRERIRQVQDNADLTKGKAPTSIVRVHDNSIENSLSSNHSPKKYLALESIQQVEMREK